MTRSRGHGRYVPSAEGGGVSSSRESADDGRRLATETIRAAARCWTPSGAGGGGTGQAIRIARHYGVLVFDLALPKVRHRVESWLTRSGGS